MRLDVRKIKREFNRLNKNQSQIAKEMGVSRQLLSFWLKSESIIYAQAFADALNFDGKDLILEDKKTK